MVNGVDKIIALSGFSNKGKTTTLKLLLKLIYKGNEPKDYGMCRPIPNNVKYLKNGTFLEMINSDADVWAVFDFDGILVGITTQGDSKVYLKEIFGKFKKYNCKLYVCACHPRGETIGFVKEECNNFIIHDVWTVETSLNCVSIWNDAQKKQAEEIDHEIFDYVKMN